MLRKVKGGYKSGRAVQEDFGNNNSVNELI